MHKGRYAPSVGSRGCLFASGFPKMGENRDNSVGFLLLSNIVYQSHDIFFFSSSLLCRFPLNIAFSYMSALRLV